MPSVAAFADRLIAACLDGRPNAPLVEQLAATVDLLLDAGGDDVYEAIHERAEQLLGAFATRNQANSYVLRFWLVAPPADWEEWHGRLRDDPPTFFQDTQAGEIIERAFQDFASFQADEQQALPVQIASLLAFVDRAGGDEASVPSFIPAVEDALTRTDWWIGTTEIEEEQRLHAAARELRQLESVEERINEALVTDLVRAVRAAPGDQATADAVLELAHSLPGVSVERIATQIPAADFDADPATASSLLNLRVRLATQLRAAGEAEWETDAFRVDGTLAEQAMHAEEPVADDAIRTWLGLKPPRSAVSGVLQTARGRPSVPELRGALGTWATDAERRDRTALVRTLINRPDDPSRWIEVIAAAGVAEKGLIELLAAKMRDAGNEFRRQRVARKARALRPQGAAGQRQLADVVISLLRSGRPKADIAVATTVVEGLGTDHQSTRRLSKAFRDATRRHDEKLTEKQIEVLQAAGIEIPKNAVKKSLFQRIFG